MEILQITDSIAIGLSDEFTSLGRAASSKMRFQTGLTDLILRGLFVFGTPIVICSFLFVRGTRSDQLQWVAGMAGFLSGLLVPLGAFADLARHHAIWVILVGGLALLIMPSVLSFYLFRRKDRQGAAALAGYAFLILMLLWNFI